MLVHKCIQMDLINLNWVVSDPAKVGTGKWAQNPYVMVVVTPAEWKEKLQ